METDIVYLNIRKNMNGSKTPSWFASSRANSRPIQEVALVMTAQEPRNVTRKIEPVEWKHQAQ